MKKGFRWAIVLILSGAVLILFSTAVPEKPLELPWNNLGLWSTNSPDKPYISDNKVVLPGDGAKYYFRLTGDGGSSLADLTAGYKFLRMEFLSHGFFGIHLHIIVEDEKGKSQLTTLFFVPYDTDTAEPAWRQIRVGIGEEIQDGNWHTLWLDLTSLKEFFPFDKFIWLKDIVIYGDCSVGGMELYKNLPAGEVVTRPERIKWTSHYFWETLEKADGTEIHRRILWVFTQYNNDGTKQSWVKFVYTYTGENTSYDYYTGWEYDSNDKLKLVYRSEAGVSGVSRSYFWTPEMVLRMEGISYWTLDKEIKKWFYNGIFVYLHKDGTPWYIVERKNDSYRGGESGSRTWVFGRPTGNLDIKKEIEDVDIKNGFEYFSFIDTLKDGWEVKRRIDEEFIHNDKGLIESHHLVYDGNDHLLIDETRWHIPEDVGSQGDWGIWTEKKYENKTTRTRNLYGERLGGGLFSNLECDYTPGGNLDEIRVNYLLYDNMGNLKEIRTYFYDSKGDLKEAKQRQFDSFNLSWYIFNMFPDNGVDVEKGVKVLSPKNLVVDGDMQEDGVRPWWLVGEGLIVEKDGEGLRVERVHKEGEEGPGFLTQVVPTGGGWKQLRIDYTRESGTACIEVWWVPVEAMWVRKPLEAVVEESGMLLEEYTDDYNIGPQQKDLVFQCPDEVGVLVLKIGAGSVVEYSRVELRPYTYSPEPESGSEGNTEIDTSKEEDIVQYVQEEVPTGDGVSFNVVETTTTPDGGKEYRIEQRYNDIPVSGAYVLVVEKDGKKVVKEKNIVEDIKLPPKPPHIRTILGSAIRKDIKGERISDAGVTKERVGEGPLELVIASEDGTPERLRYGWRVKGSGKEEKIYDIESGEKLFSIKKPASSALAPGSIIHKEETGEERNSGYTLKGLIRYLKNYVIGLLKRYIKTGY